LMMFFFCQAEDVIRDRNVTGVQTCALPISSEHSSSPVFVNTTSSRVLPAVPCMLSVSIFRSGVAHRPSRLRSSPAAAGPVESAVAVAVDSRSVCEESDCGLASSGESEPPLQAAVSASAAAPSPAAVRRAHRGARLSAEPEVVAPGEVLVTKGLVRLLPSWDAEGVKSCEIVTILTRWTVARYSVR